MILIHEIDKFALYFSMIFNSMYHCMKTLGQVFLENIEWSSTIYIYIYIQNLYNYINEFNLCLCYLLYFLNKNVYYYKEIKPFLFENQPETLFLLPNNACSSFSWFPIERHLMLIACVLIQDVNGFRFDQWSKIYPRQVLCQICLKTWRVA